MPFPDYEAFIAALNAHGVRYLVVGAHAVAFHARPRATKDLDLLIDPTPENARKTLSALEDFFGGVNLGYTPQELMNPQFITQLGIAPVRIDLLRAKEAAGRLQDRADLRALQRARSAAHAPYRRRRR